MHKINIWDTTDKSPIFVLGEMLIEDIKPVAINVREEIGITCWHMYLNVIDKITANIGCGRGKIKMLNLIDKFDKLIAKETKDIFSLGLNSFRENLYIAFNLTNAFNDVLSIRLYMANESLINKIINREGRACRSSINGKCRMLITSR